MFSFVICCLSFINIFHVVNKQKKKVPIACGFLDDLLAAFFHGRVVE